MMNPRVVAHAVLQVRQHCYDMKNELSFAFMNEYERGCSLEPVLLRMFITLTVVMIIFI